MRNYQKHYGIDVSKAHFDIAVYLPESHTVQYLERVENTPVAIEAWLSSGKHDFMEAVVCMEYTGMYINFLVAALAHHKIDTWVQNALEIKRSLGVQKGKTDKLDAQRIAKYAYRNEDDVRLYIPTSDTLQRLDILHQTHTKLSVMLQQLQVPLNEAATFCPLTHSLLQEHTHKTIDCLKESLEKLTTDIADTIAKDRPLQQLHTLLKTVTGVGDKLATTLLIVTQAFTKFKTVKQLASYAAVAPFANSSGKRASPDRISLLAHKRLKSILYMAALGLIRTKEDLSAYYHRKRKEGKLHRVVMNALCNKLLQRIWAVVKSGKDYKKRTIEFEKFESSKSKKNNQKKIEKNLQKP
jgi:transposase